MHLGEINPISGSNYAKWIKMWEPLDPIILELEELQKDTEFPHSNKTVDERGSKPEISDELRELTVELLDYEVRKFNYPIWSVDSEWDMKH